MYKDHYWVQKNPFRVTENPTEFLATDYEYLVEITSDIQLKNKFQEVPLDILWGHLCVGYSETSKETVRILLPFAIAYLFESEF